MTTKVSMSFDSRPRTEEHLLRLSHSAESRMDMSCLVIWFCIFAFVPPSMTLLEIRLELSLKNRQGQW